MNYIQSEKNYYYKLYKNGKKKRISFEIYQKGGAGKSKEKIEQELKNSGKNKEWEEKGHLYGIIEKGNKNKRIYNCTLIDGTKMRFSTISNSYLDGKIHTPIFDYVNTSSKKELMIQELKDAGKYYNWIKSGSKFGYIHEDLPRYYQYETMNGSEYFSSIHSEYLEKNGKIIKPVFDFIKSLAPRTNNAVFSRAGPDRVVPARAVPARVVRRNMSAMANNIISPERLEAMFKSLIENKWESLLILIGESHIYNPEINSYIQFLILEIINSLSKEIVPIYSEMPKEIMANINKNNNKNMVKILKTEKSSFLRLYYYLKYLQVPKGKNIIIPSDISEKNRLNKSCNPEYSEDIKKICEENDVTVGIMGAFHIKCIKDILDNFRLTNGKTLKVITIISNTAENMLDLVNKCTGKLSKNNSKNSYNIGCDALIDSISLDIPGVSELGEELFKKIMLAVFPQ